MTTRPASTTTKHQGVRSKSAEMSDQQTISDLRQQVRQLGQQVAELTARAESAEDALAGMEVCLVDGYFVLLWQEDGAWVAHCPAVGANVVLDDREAALDGIADDMKEMIAALSALGCTPPEKDIPC